MRNRYIYLLALLFLIKLSVKAQDPVFTQVYASPILINPALAGAFDGAYKLSTIYRDQWRSGMTQPYQTYLFSAEGKFEVSYNKTYTPDIVGVGMTFLSDKVDHFGLSTNQIQLVASYHKSLDKNTDQYLGLGFSGGITQKSINYDNLSFEDQFDQLGAYTLPTGEVFPPNNLGYADFSIGINYAVSPNPKTRIYAGGSYQHFFTPNVSFFNQFANPNPTIDIDNRLSEKLIVYASSKHYLNEDLYILPRVYFANQKSHLEITPGANIAFPLSFASELIIGTAVRLVDNIDGIKPASGILSAALQFKDFQFGFSYDLNIQDITQDRSGLDAFEFSISFNGNYTNEVDICPTF